MEEKFTWNVRLIVLVLQGIGVSIAGRTHYGGRIIARKESSQRSFEVDHGSVFKSRVNIA